MIYSLLFVLISSFASVLIQKLYLSIPSVFTLLVTATIATIYFNIVNLHKLKIVYRQCLQQKHLWLAIMLVILVMWYCTMTGPGLIGASSYQFAYFSWLGALGFLSKAIQSSEHRPVNLIAGIGTIFLITVTMLSLILQNHITIWFAVGLLMPLVGGTSSFIYFKQTQLFTQRINLKPTQVLAVRFYLAIICLIIIAPLVTPTEVITLKNFGWLTLLAFASLIAPLYCVQKALSLISSEQNAIILSLTPINTAFLQELVFRDVEWSHLAIYLLYSLLLFTTYVLRYWPFKRQRGN